jgi:NDP-sugar pyrophosphorylase family protein
MKPILLIPMAGKGQRFIDKGFETPKPLIEVGGKTILEWSFDSFNWRHCDLVFVVRKEMVENHNLENFIKEKFGLDSKIVVSETDTDGTVSSCLLAKEYINNDRELFITTLDVFFTPYFDFEKFDFNSDGCILTFDADNPAYSYSQVDENGYVTRTTEKELISNNASVGLYCFKKGSEFVKYSEKMIKNNLRTRNEFYIAPLYNLLIEDNLKINTYPINKMYHMGTPDEMNYFINNELKDVLNEVR